MNRYIILIALILALLTAEKSHSQCGCSGAPIAGGTPFGNVAVSVSQSSGYFYASGYYRYTFGDDYYTGSTNSGTGYVQYSKTSYLGVYLSYGLNKDWSIDGDFGYYLNKKQDFGLFFLESRGLSNFTLSAKYHLYDHLSEKINILLSGGLRVPLNNFSESTDNTLPQHLKTSNGALGGFLSLIIRKGFSGTDINLFLINRFDYNGKNREGYQYGPSLYSSLIGIKKIIGDLTGILELRNEYKSRDNLNKSTLDSTGNNVINLSPQLAYSIGKWSISAAFDYPIFKNYNGSQLSNSWSSSLNMSLGL